MPGKKSKRLTEPESRLARAAADEIQGLDFGDEWSELVESIGEGFFAVDGWSSSRAAAWVRRNRALLYELVEAKLAGASRALDEAVAARRAPAARRRR